MWSVRQCFDMSLRHDFEWLVVQADPSEARLAAREGQMHLRMLMAKVSRVHRLLILPC